MVQRKLAAALDMRPSGFFADYILVVSEIMSIFASIYTSYLHYENKTILYPLHPSDVSEHRGTDRRV